MNYVVKICNKCIIEKPVLLHQDPQWLLLVKIQTHLKFLLITLFNGFKNIYSFNVSSSLYWFQINK